VGYYDQNASQAYLTQVGSAVAPPTSPASYLLQVPSGNNYFFFAVLDQNNDGVFDPGDITNFNSYNMITPAVAISGPATENLTLSSGNSSTVVRTQNSNWSDEWGTSQSYGLFLDVTQVGKLPIAVELTSAPATSNIVTPADIAWCYSCGSDMNSSFDADFNVGSTAPAVGDSYGVKVSYPDGTSDTATPKVTGVVPNLPTNLSPAGPQSTINNSPDFTWSYPNSAGSYLYNFWLGDSNWNTIWSIPNSYSGSNDFTSTLSPSLTLAGGDPTDPINTPSISTLTTGSLYYWDVQAFDAHGNYATYGVDLVSGYAPLALPNPNPSSLGSAISGQPYSGSITATGGYAGYSYAINGSYCYGCTTSLSNGLTVTNANDTLTIGGTPSSAGLVSFTVSAQDNVGAQTGQVTYTINVNAADGLSLPAPNPSSLGPTVTGLSYFGSISAMGGVGPYSWQVNGLSDNLNLYYTGSEYDSIILYGTPYNTGTVTFNVTVTDSTGASYGPVAYSIVVNHAVAGTYAVSGNVSFNGCASGNNPPIMLTLTNGGGITQITASDSNGTYQFPSVPNGSFTITPSITGPSSSSFSPASQPITVSSSNQVINFNAYVGYTVSGQVNYSGADSGQVYTSLTGCGNTTPGTSISAPGVFTIHGVPPGTYTLNAWMDNKTVATGEQLGGYGVQNASNPTGSVSNLLVPNDNITNLTVGMTDPSAITLSSAPAWTGQASGAFSGGAIVSFTPIMNSSSIEIPSSYTLEYSTDSTFATGVASKSFPATGGKNAGFASSLGVGGQQGGNSPWVVTGLTNSSTYYFRAAGVVGSGTSAVTGPWSAPSPGLLINAPSSGNAVSGKVTFSAPTGGSINGPLYVGYWNQNTGSIYAEEFANPVSPQAYSVDVPTGSNYFFFAFIDQNNDGMIDPGDITNAFNYNMITPSVNIAGALTNQNLALSSANSSAMIFTGNNDGAGYSGTSSTQSYSLDLMVSAVNKLPVSVELLSGSNVLAPMDISVCPGCGVDLNSRISGRNLQLNSALAPAVGNAYGVKVVYSDGTSETLNPQVTGVLPMITALDLSPIGPVTASNLTPTFSWQYPTNPSNYHYQFWLADERTWTTTWSIPNVYSASNSFTSSVSSIPWGTDPTGVINNTPTISNMVNGDTYGWEIVAYDANGNRSQASGSYTPGYTALALPAANPNSLGSATLNQPYSGSIAASGGYLDFGGGYSGFSVNCSDCFGDPSVSLGNGLTANGSWGQGSLTITGTPYATGPVTFSVYVEDASGAVVGPVTYTINVNNYANVSLPSASNNPLGSGLAGMAYSGAINASGGPGGGNYAWTVNGVALTPNNPYVYTSVSNGDGLTVATSGGNTLWFAGTPAAVNAGISIVVTVTDMTNSSDTASVTYTVPVVAGPNGANNKYLSGTYVCKMDGFNDSDGSRWAALASFQASGAGTFTNGVWDQNSRDLTTEMSGTMTGTYSIGADNNGLLNMSSTVTSGGSGIHPSQFAIALNNTGSATTATEFRMVETDDVGASSSNQHGTGDCYQATTTGVFGTDVFAGNSFVFLINGEDSSGDPKADLGRFYNASGTAAGSLTGGVVDEANIVDTSVTTTTVTSGSYTLPDATNGRSTLTLTASGAKGGTITFEIYVIDANRMFMIETDEARAQSADVRKQQQATYSGANLSGPFVLYTQTYDYSNGSVSSYASEVMQGTGNDAGGLTINQNYTDEGGTYKVGNDTGSVSLTFDSSNPGRASMGASYLYFFNNNTAFFLTGGASGGSGSPNMLETGWAEPQTQTTFTNAKLGGDYLTGPLPLMSAAQNVQIGEVNLSTTSSSAFTGELTEGGAGVFSFDQPFSGPTYAWDTTTTAKGTFLIPLAGMSCAVINPTEAVCTNQTGFPAITILQQ
jgi:hypothetical protein